MQILPSETLYSYLVRHCLTCAYPNATQALLNEIGATSKQWTAQFPCFIPQLSEITGLTPEVLIRRHTVYMAYRPFLSKAVAFQVEKLLVAGGSMNLESKMSIPANRVKRASVLRYCPLCVKEDVEQFYWPYWHVDHQLPGAIACLKHGCELDELIINRKKLQLPPVSSKLTSQASNKAMRFTSLGHQLFSQKFPNFKPELIVQTYKEKLLEVGLATSPLKIRVRMKKWRVRIDEYWKEISCDEQLSHIIALGRQQLFPSNLIYCRNVTFHPLKHLLAIGFLFPSINDFKDAYHQVEIGTSLNYITENKAPAKKKFVNNEDIVRLLKKGTSLRAVAKEFSVSVCYVKKIAQIKRIPINRRTQFIFEKERRTIWRKLFIGSDRKIIAKEMKVSIGAVEQILSSYPELVILRKKIRFFNKRSKHRDKIINAFVVFITRNEIKGAESASYLWLFKNDKTWLYEHLPVAIPRQNRFLCVVSNKFDRLLK